MACRLLHTVFVRHGREEPLPPEAVKGAQDERRKDTPTLCQKLGEKAILKWSTRAPKRLEKRYSTERAWQVPIMVFTELA